MEYHFKACGSIFPALPDKDHRTLAEEKVMIVQLLLRFASKLERMDSSELRQNTCSQSLCVGL